MAKTLNSRDFYRMLPSRKIAQQKLIRKIRARPINGGLNTFVTAELIKPNQSPHMRDVRYVRNEMRKAKGGVQLGADFPDPVLRADLWERLNGTTILPVAISQKHLYYYDQADSAWKQVTPSPAPFILGGSIVERYVVKFLHDEMYFVSKNNSLRRWDGVPANTHSAIATGFPAKGMMVLNNHIVLVATTSGGTFEGQTIRWSADVGITPDFTAVGSGARDLADKEDLIQNCASIGPYRGLIYKGYSIVDIKVTGNLDLPFETTEAVGGIGLLCAYSLTEWLGGHFFVASDEQIYLYSGSSLEAIGNDIKNEFFPLVNQAGLDIVTGFFDHIEREYVILVPTLESTAGHIYYAYKVDDKVWRSGEYHDATWIATYRSKLGGSWDEMTGSWDHEVVETWDADKVVVTRPTALISTFTKRVFRLDENSRTFDGAPLEFEWNSAEVVGEQEGDEVTLSSFLVSYIVDGTSSLIFDVSLNDGATYVSEVTKSLGGAQFASGSTQTVRFSPIVTGQKMRMRIRNANAAEKVRIVGIEAWVGFTKSSRSEAKQ